MASAVRTFGFGLADGSTAASKVGHRLAQLGVAVDEVGGHAGSGSDSYESDRLPLAGPVAQRLAHAMLRLPATSPGLPPARSAAAMLVARTQPAPPNPHRPGTKALPPARAWPA
jgi:hypothetical protein